MADNSDNRKKALIMFVLLFLFAGGGIFLYFIIQGANDLTGAGKNNFTYSGAVRDGVSSFFKYIGLDSEGAALSKAKSEVSEIHQEKIADAQGATDWMTPSGNAGGSASAARAPSGRTAVPRMGGGSLSGAGGASGGGTQSSSSFGDENGSGKTSIKGGLGGASGLKGKSSTLDSLRNSQALLNSGLRSGSAMTAKSKWDASFGVSASGRGGGDLAYGKSGLVSLDKIKSGEIADLKTTGIKTLGIDAPAPLQDKDAESKDSVLNKAKQEAADAAAKKAAEQAAASAASSALSNVGGTAGPTSNAANNNGNNPTGADPKIPDSVTNLAKSGVLQNQTLSNGMKYSDADARVMPNSDGTFKITYNGNFTAANGTVIQSQDSYIVSADGKTVTPYYGK
jgi:hypothetical protein